MASRRIKAELLIGAAVLLVTVGVGGTVLRPDLEPDQTIESSFGDVAWNHEQHARMEDIANCQVCHHQEEPGEANPRSCRTCHKIEDNFDLLVQGDLFMDVVKKEYKDEYGPPPMTSFHASCTGCHVAMNEGPRRCRDCHAPVNSGLHGTVQWDHRTHSRKIFINQDGSDTTHDCVSCHHQDTEAETAADYRPCNACHEPVIAMGLEAATELVGIAGPDGIKKHQDAMHGECASCHTELNPENDLRSCAECHLSWKHDVEQKELPSLEQAVHLRCQECHNQEYEDLNPAMPTSCTDCHQPEPSWLNVPEVGNVLWNHKRHGNYRKLECITCHHQDLPEEPHMACKNCHDTGLYDNPPLQEALTKRCLGCHEEEKTGLDTWDQLVTQEYSVEHFKLETELGTLWWDHHAHAIGDSFACQDCHHSILRKDGEYVTEIRAKKPWTKKEARLQSCRNCHGESGPVADSIAEGTEAPDLEKAMQKVCLECHQRLEGGPQTWESFFAEPEIDWEIRARTEANREIGS